MSELRGLGVINDEMVKQGGELVAISADAPKDAARVAERNKLPFRVLSDTDMTAIDAYGLRHKGGGPDGGDIAIPAHFLIGSDGRVLWKYVASLIQDRVDPQRELTEIRARLNKP
ncbi:MAG: redoxin domain-containing protein [Phycisphaerales bacterium]|nr:redoxin domain-containing protein [Phycisphaerales bacterium]